MRLALRLPAILLLSVIAGCGAKTTGHSVSVNPFAPPPAEMSAPPAPPPTEDGSCPYLDTGDVERVTGEPVATVRRSAASPDQTCVFLRVDGTELLSVRHYAGTPATAIAISNKAVPVGTGHEIHAEGWQGRSRQSPDGGAIAMDYSDSALVILSDRGLRGRVEKLATEVITKVS